jgi:transposase
MTDQERMAQLEAENATLRQYLAEAVETIARLEQRIAELEGRLAKDSHNSSKPPSSDGLGRRRWSHRRPSGKAPGAQPGHPGHTLAQVAEPDQVVPHRPAVCGACQQSLETTVGEVVECRQVQELPPLRLVVTEHRVEQVRCPACQALTRGAFPSEVRAPAQYGPGVQALAVYLHQAQFLPEARTGDVLADLCGAAVSDGTIAAWVQQASATLGPTVARIADLVATSTVQHGDETGARINGTLHWLHVNSTRHLTHLAWHPKRGKVALEAIGIWARLQGRAVRDRWASYDAYPCAQSLCNAHLVRELTALHEAGHDAWAGDLKDLLLGLHAAAQQWRAQGATRLPTHERDDWLAQYFAILARGYAAQPPPPAAAPAGPRRRGRRKQSAAKNLLDALLQRAEQVLAFADDLRVPFTNNQAERDLRPVKLQQKISGTFRSDAGATAYCRLRSYLSTMRKQGQPLLRALRAVFDGQPFPIAWGS